MPGMTDIRVDLVADLFQEPGDDWDRRTHRMMVLASVAPPNLTRSWVRRQPNSADALLFRAWADLVQGRREGGLADPQETFDACYRAAELRPEDPAPWLAMLRGLRLLARPTQEVFPVWREVTTRDPWHREAYLQMLGYLSPEECGSHTQVLDFLDATRAGMPPNAPAVGVELVAMVDRYWRAVAAGGVDALMAARLWTQPPAAAALERAVTEWPRPGFLRHAAALADLNTLAYGLVHAKRTPDAAPVFQLIGGTVTAFPWKLDGDPIKQFGHAQAQALR